MALSTTIDFLERAGNDILAPAQAAVLREALTRVEFTEVDGIRVCAMDKVRAALAGNEEFTNDTFVQLVRRTGSFIDWKHTEAIRKAKSRINANAPRTDIAATDQTLAEAVLERHIASEGPNPKATTFSVVAYIGSAARGVWQSIRPRV